MSQSFKTMRRARQRTPLARRATVEEANSRIDPLQLREFLLATDGFQPTRSGPLATVPMLVSSPSSPFALRIQTLVSADPDMRVTNPGGPEANDRRYGRTYQPEFMNHLKHH